MLPEERITRESSTAYAPGARSTKGESMEHGSGTHAIFNQTPPLTDYNLFGTDTALQEAVQREGAGWAIR